MASGSRSDTDDDPGIKSVCRNRVIIVTSGAMKVRKDDLPEGGQFVPKPYRGDRAARLIEELVGA